MNQYILTLLTISMLISCKDKPHAVEARQQSLQADSLEMALNAINETGALPGFAVSIFTSDSILYQKGFGYSDLESKKTYSVNDVQIVASITKTLTGVALMKTVEDGLLELDMDINEILPFKISNPYYPEEKISLRMLAAHTSSISDDNKFDEGYRFDSPLLEEEFPERHKPFLENLNKTEDMSLGEFLKRKLHKEGIWYENDIFLNAKPGSTYDYSNYGMALLAHIIELKTKVPFDQFTKTLILEPLKMHNSSWSLKDISESKHATGYNEIKNEVPKYQIITYPDGGLYSSVNDMTLYLQEMIRGYNGQSDLLSETSFTQMMSKQFEGEDQEYGVTWDLYNGLIGHAGNDFGTATLMYFSPKSGVGRIMFTNISTETEELQDAYYGVYNTLFLYDLNK